MHVIRGVLEHRRALGRLVEVLGNQVRLDGLRISVESPLIDTPFKARVAAGTWEANTRALIKAHLPGDLPVVEFGAGIGVVSCVTNRALAEPRRHVVVEANPGLISTLTKNRDLNGCEFEIVHAALAYDAAHVPFYVDSRIHRGRIDRHSRTDAFSVPATDLGSVLETAAFDGVSLILDVEGSEWEFFAREAKTVADHVRWIFVDLHGTLEESQATAEAIRRLGFSLVESHGRDHAFRRTPQDPGLEA